MAKRRPGRPSKGESASAMVTFGRTRGALQLGYKAAAQKSFRDLLVWIARNDAEASTPPESAFTLVEEWSLRSVDDTQATLFTYSIDDPYAGASVLLKFVFYYVDGTTETLLEGPY